MTRVLVADDSDAMREGMMLTLARLGYDVQGVKGGAEAIAAYAKRRADVVVTDLRMVPVDGLEVVRRVREKDPEATLLVVTAHGSVTAAVEAMRAGAVDFLEKPFPAELLAARIEKAAEIARERRRSRDAHARADALDADRAREAGPLGLVGAPATRPCSCSGRPGRARSSSRARSTARADAARPFVAVNCAAIPDCSRASSSATSAARSPARSAPRGASSGRRRHALPRRDRRDGPRRAGRSSLRVLEERQFRRVGGTATTPRSTCASSPRRTATSSATIVERRSFPRTSTTGSRSSVHGAAAPRAPGGPPAVARGSLFSSRRAPAAAPPVGFARGDVARYPWPGNVRELENVVQQAMVFCEGERVQVEDLPAALRAAPAALPVPTGDRPLPDILEDLERELVAAAYQRARGVKAEAARLLGLKPSALYYKLEKYGIGPPGEGGTPEGS